MVTILKDISVPGIHVIPCRLNGPRGVVKAFLLDDQKYLTLIDTGFSDADTTLIIDRIHSIGRSLDELTLVLLTHRHGDHVGGLRRLIAEAPWVRTLCHSSDASAIVNATGVAVDGSLTDGDTLPEFEGIQVVHMPGHTPGSVAFYLRHAKALIAGDAIVSAGEHLMVSPQFLCDDPLTARQSVKRLLEMHLDIDIVLVAHGDDVYQDAAAPLGRILLERRTVPA
jgi:glyoxylase-like metal-dependent hydrolase (beta-lactamase superfamily II)